jgi:hypothetical protein
MSGSIASRDRECHFRGDRSVGSCLSSASGRRKSKRLIVDGLENSLYLPNNLRVLDCDKSLQELDATVASVTKHHITKNSLDNGERSPTSVSEYIPGGGKSALVAEQVLLHLSQPSPFNFRRVESGSVRSGISRSSKSSKSSGGRRSRSSRKKRKGTLEEKVCQAILSAASNQPASNNSNKFSNPTACRSAQFILTDLFYEACRVGDESALPNPPFGDGTSWSQIQTENDLGEERPESSVPKISLHARECQASENPSFLSKTSGFQPGRVEAVPSKDDDIAEEKETVAVRLVPKADPPGSNLCVGWDTAIPEPPRARTLGDIIRDAETESETSAFFVFDAEEEHATNFTLRRDNTMGAPSECTGTLEFSIDDSMLQYSSTNGTSTFSHFGRGGEEAFPQASYGQKSTEEEQWDQTGFASETDNWTMFEKSPFNETEENDGFGFGAFSPFGDNEEDAEAWPVAQSKKYPVADIDAAWDPNTILPGSSPDSPASVFRFFSNDEDDFMAADSKSDTLWNISDVDFQGPAF